MGSIQNGNRAYRLSREQHANRGRDRAAQRVFRQNMAELPRLVKSKDDGDRNRANILLGMLRRRIGAIIELPKTQTRYLIMPNGSYRRIAA